MVVALMQVNFMSQQCHRGVTIVSKHCNRVVTTLFQHCDKGVTTVLLLAVATKLVNHSLIFCS